MNSPRERLEVVRAGIASAVAASGRDAESITTVVVTKFHPASLVRELHALGVRNVGENRHQEAQAKSSELSDLDLTWHFVGQLQSNKARSAVEYARIIHSLDRTSLVDSLSATGRKSGDTVIESNVGERQVEVFVQLNLTEDPDRGGVVDAELESLAERVVASGALRLLGVMAVAPRGEDPRAAFARLRAASERVSAIEPTATFISAGMSGDYREAILEGATHLRIGSAITGNRPVPG